MKTPWKPEEEAKLHELYRERKIMVPTGQMWEPISLRLQELGIIKTSRECKLKYYSFLDKKRRQKKVKKQKRSARPQSGKLPQKLRRAKSPVADTTEGNDIAFDLILGTQVKQNADISEEKGMPEYTDENSQIFDAKGNVLPGLFCYDGDHPASNTERGESLYTCPESDFLWLHEQDLSYLRL